MMKFDPSESVLKCPYCSHENVIPQSEDDIVELDFHKALADMSNVEESVEQATIKCTSCGASTTLQENISADACPFCGASIVSAQEQQTTSLKPKSLLPFKISRENAMEAFRSWVSSRWFAPNKLKEYARSDTSNLSGIYVPYWTYDSMTTSWYTGQRGDYYYTTESYTTTENGKSVRRTRQVRHTRWTSVSGVIVRAFDDVLILASKSLPKKYADKLEPWDLENLETYDEQYLSGFRAETYQVGLAEGFGQAQIIMDKYIRKEVRYAIGGDEQRISSVKTQHDNITFKHLLLPIWISAYQFKEETYRFLVNARTGEVQGERPWSWVKIAALAAGVIAVIAVVAYFLTQR